MQDVHEQLYAFNNTPIGTLRVSAVLQPWRKILLAGLTAKLLKKYPGLAVNLVTEFRPGLCRRAGRENRVGALQDSTCFPMEMVRCRWLCAPPSLPRSVRRPGKTRRSR
ncbi:hypothetical protein KCP69_05720 [Salmonella enterica subsp. enterica]|nr:hypothetical protein KCP69_05720 [Salmonella enterica subsp. enterica]